MKLSLEWLNSYVDLRDQSVENISHALTMIGFEVEGVSSVGLSPLENVVVGEILSFEPHPNADRLSLCQVRVDDGDPRSIICGAKNFKAEDRVIVALPGAVLPGDFKIKKAKLRGVPSEGMMCSERELGLGDDHEGIAILEERPPIGTSVNDLFPGSDTVFDVEITPNRPDVLSHLGMARELAAWFNRTLKYPSIRVNLAEMEAGGAIASVESTEPELCPHYRGYSVEGVEIKDSPDWLKRRIHAIGLRPVNNVVDVTNLVLHETGQPLHAFDTAKIRGGKIIVRPASDKEEITTLDDKKRLLDPSILVIADVERPLVVAGVMGSIDAEVDESTRDIFLEAAHFNPVSIRKTSKKLTLSTDSSYRFERGVDPRGVEFAALRCLDLILEVAGGKVKGPPRVFGEAPLIEKEIALKPEFVRRRLGFRISDEEIVQHLKNLELEVADDIDPEGLPVLRVAIPSWRLDLYRPIDLVEEVLRLHGADRIPEGEVEARGLLSEDDTTVRFQRTVSRFLVGRGLLEALHYTLRSGGELDQWQGAGRPGAEVANPLAKDASVLRSSLLPGLLDCVQLNQARRNDPRGLFEVGRVFEEQEGSIRELVSVAFVLLDPTEPQWKSPLARDFFDASNLMQPLLKAAGLQIGLHDFEPLDDSVSWQAGQAARAGNSHFGWKAEMGLLDVGMTRGWDIAGNVFAGSLVILPERLKARPERTRFEPFSLQPPAVRDLALIVDQNDPAGKVQSQLEVYGRKTCGETFHLESVRLFDLYEGEGLPKGKKSLAFNLVYRSLERTLKDKEVNTAFENLQKTLEAKTSFRVRR